MTAPATAAVLEVRDVAVHYGAVKAVDGVSMTLTAGRIFGILGPNGSGKTTLLGALTRQVDLTRGSVSLAGVPYERVPTAQVAKRGIARTFQTVRLLPGLTVYENVMLAADLRRDRGGAAARERVERAMERTRVTGLARARPGELSYGMQRKVEIARAIALDPVLLLLDEPTAGMNHDERLEVSGLLGELRDQGLTQLLVEHDVQMMVDTCDHLFGMSSGVLIAEGPPLSVVRDPAVREAYLGKRWRDHA